MVEIINIEPVKLTVDQTTVLSGLGMQPSDADDSLLQIIENLFERSKASARPKACFAVVDAPIVDSSNHTVLLNDHTFSVGKKIAALLKKSEKMVVFAVTIGGEVEQLSKGEMASGNMLEGLIIDLLASEMVESTANALHDYIEGRFEEKGLKDSNRYSPGYCEWHLSEQKMLFSILGKENCGIHLNESFLMLPEKSISGFIGLGKEIRKMDYACRICNDENCIMRKV